MRILLTGGAGFIGSWVAENYLKEGHEVLIYDNLSSGAIENIPQDAEFTEGDILDYSLLEQTIIGFRPDIVNHHAAQINVRVSVEDPAFDAETNIIGAINLLQLSVKNNISKFIFASTGGAIYGEPAVIPANESTEKNPLSPYGTSKLCVENYLNYYNKVYNLKYTALRYSNVYGERQNPHGEAGVVAIFCTNILKGKDCNVFGSGDQTRDYVHAEDVARANALCLEAENGIYNVGTSVSTSVNDIIDKLTEFSDIDFNVVHLPAKEGEVENISLDYSHTEKSINWSPTIDFDTGLKRTWQWFRNNVE
ncbi:MAG: NAD-dependent epimerase/dehydratase family protein [Proteobacteria bacterium]|nr:NAD-dependent epimerase/dehydratase family protein [Pseudomonadota bacterium]